MIAEQGSISPKLRQVKVIPILTESLAHQSINVKRNVSEALAFLLKDVEMRNSIQDERIIVALLNELRMGQDQVHTENVLLCLMHLSYHKKFKSPLYEANIIETLLHKI